MMIYFIADNNKKKKHLKPYQNNQFTSLRNTPQATRRRPDASSNPILLTLLSWTSSEIINSQSNRPSHRARGFRCTKNVLFHELSAGYRGPRIQNARNDTTRRSYRIVRIMSFNHTHNTRSYECECV